MKNINHRYRLSPAEEYALLESRKNKKEISVVNNVLVVSDLHQPFTHKYALEHCISVYNEYNCNKVIFIGDLVDSHASSFHDADPDGYSAGSELQRSIEALREWYRVFPEAIVIIGNHDRIIIRKAFKSGVSKEWIKDYNEVLEVPNWKFMNEYVLDGVKYIHGEGGGSSLQTILQSNEKSVWGHWHSKFEIMHTYNNWGMCVGCLIDRESYAFAYAKLQVKKQLIGVGVVLNNGTLPILLKLDEKKYENSELK